MTPRRILDTVLLLVIGDWTLLLCMNSISPVSSYQKGQVVAFFQSTCASSVPNPCQQICVDIRSGGFYCQCQLGFVISDDGMTCHESKAGVETVVSDGVSTAQHRDPRNDSVSETSKSNNSHSVHFHPDKLDSVNSVDYGQSISLKQGLPSVQTDFHIKPNTDARLVLDNVFYNVPEGGTDGQYDDSTFNYFSLPEGGDYDSKVNQTKGGTMPISEEAAISEAGQGVSCDRTICKNNGTCTVMGSRAVCQCPLGTSGEHCDRVGLVHIPYFTEHSYLEFPGLARLVLSYTEIELAFKPSSPDGTLLYNGCSRDRKGDFISLALHEGYLEFQFDLGTGPAIIRSAGPLATNSWHSVRASRTGLMGSLEVDGQVLRTGQAQGAYTQLTLLDSLYLGGHPNNDHTSKHANITKSFSGCLQKVVINKHAIDLLSGALSGINIGPCSHSCAGSPCMHGGECNPHLDTYTCSCPIGFGNTNCEDAQEQVMEPMFTGDSYLTYIDREITKRVSGNRLDLQIHIRPQGHDGLLFWSGLDLSNKLDRDYFSLGFHSGSLLLRYNLGSGEAVIEYNNSDLFDGNWHFIRVQRDKQNAYMEVDRKDIVEGSSPGVCVSLNTNQIVYLGGIPHIGEKTRGRYTAAFSGCIRDLKLATDYNVKLLSQARAGRNIQQCLNRNIP